MTAMIQCERAKYVVFLYFIDFSSINFDKIYMGLTDDNKARTNKHLSSHLRYNIAIALRSLYETERITLKQLKQNF